LNPYEGRDLSQLLDLMHGLVVPSPVSLTPQTLGWWVALGWLLAVLMLAVCRVVARRRQNRYRREALAALKSIEADGAADPAAAARRIAVLLKRTALAAYPREDVASLYGDDWSRFLCESARNDERVLAGARQLAAAAYRPGMDGAALVAPARRWIEAHRA